MHVFPRRSHRSRRATVPQVFLGGVTGLGLVVAGVALAWLAFGASVLGRLDLPLQAGPGQLAIGAIAWSTALIVPTACVVLGLARLAFTLDRLTAVRFRRDRISSLASEVADDCFVVARVRLPDGRHIPGLVVGPHGVAVVGILPQRAATNWLERQHEARLTGARWLTRESPLDRLSRDAESVRRWFAADDRDFVVKVYAALIAPDTTIPRTPACAVITRAQVGPWLASLPAQRTLTPDRRDRLANSLANLGA